jgi:hypothetical protein
MLGSSRGTAQLAAPQEGLSSVSKRVSNDLTGNRSSGVPSCSIACYSQKIFILILGSSVDPMSSFFTIPCFPLIRSKKNTQRVWRGFGWVPISLALLPKLRENMLDL